MHPLPPNRSPRRPPSSPTRAPASRAARHPGGAPVLDVVHVLAPVALQEEPRHLAVKGEELAAVQRVAHRGEHLAHAWGAWGARFGSDLRRMRACVHGGGCMLHAACGLLHAACMLLISTDKPVRVHLARFLQKVFSSFAHLLEVLAGDIDVHVSDRRTVHRRRRGSSGCLARGGHHRCSGWRRQQTRECCA